MSAVQYGAIRDPEEYKRAGMRKRTERFNSCFPRRISFSDVDSIVEINGFFLALEWKTGNDNLSAGQEQLLERLADQSKWSVLVIWTDAQGDITHVRDMYDGCGRVPIDETSLSRAFKRWAEKADAQPNYEVTRIQVATLVT